MLDNPILATDSYKLGHYSQYPANTEAVYSYFESRVGATHPETVFFGLQSILKTIRPVTMDDVIEADILSEAHFGGKLFNYDGWAYICREHGDKLPLRIKAVPEGTPVPTGNVMMTVENTDENVPWLTNAVESLLTHVWYPSTVASLSRSVKVMLADKLTRVGSPLDGLEFMLHDFGYRGATVHEAAAIGGAGHLVNFKGTDTLPAMLLAMRDYDAALDTLAFSVPATEHSVMTAEGPAGELPLVKRLIKQHDSGILSVVADSYDIYALVEAVCGRFKEDILARDGVFVVRPDSITQQHPNPELLVMWILERLWATYGGTETQKGFRVLNPHVRVLWGDGIDAHGIEKIINRAMLNGFSPENLVFGMGGGLLQKVNRDTQRFAFKSSAQKRDGVWHDVYKKPLDASKASKRGRLKLVQGYGGPMETVRIVDPGNDLLQTVFEDGRLLNEQTFDEIRARAAL